jgi:hypothetical protein
MLSVVPFVPLLGDKEERRRWVVGVRSVVRAWRRVRRALGSLGGVLLVPFRAGDGTSRSSITKRYVASGDVRVDGRPSWGAWAVAER